MYTECDLIVCHAEPAALLLYHLLLHHSAPPSVLVLCFLSLRLSFQFSLCPHLHPDFLIRLKNI